MSEESLKSLEYCRDHLCDAHLELCSFVKGQGWLVRSEFSDISEMIISLIDLIDSKFEK